VTLQFAGSLRKCNWQ